jgi:hypothetical protein
LSRKRTGVHNPNVRAFLATLEICGSVTKACRVADVSRRYVYDLRNEHPSFAAEWDAAMELALDAAEDEAMRRATEGVERFVISRGEVVKHPVTGEPLTEHLYSDTLLLATLRARRPGRWKEKSNVEFSGSVTLEQLVRGSMGAEKAG